MRGKEGESNLSRAGELLWESKRRSLSGAEKREAVKEFLIERPDLKYWQIGRELGLSSAAVQKHAFLLQQSGDVAARRPNSTKESQAQSKKIVDETPL